MEALVLRGHDALLNRSIARDPCPQHWEVDSTVVHKLLYPFKPISHVVPDPAFRIGEKILQWWARWLADAQEPPKNINKKTRAKWYVGKVLLVLGYGPIRYGGVENRPSWLYKVY